MARVIYTAPLNSLIKNTQKEISYMLESNKRTVPLFSETELSELNEELQDPVNYRKSGLSLNQIVGCPLDCAYCVRHVFNSYNMREPHAIMSDEEAVRQLVKHKYFQPNITPLQLFNRATDPFLPDVKPHTFRTLSLLDSYGYNNNLLIITRCHVSKEDCGILNKVKNLKVSILVTYSGINDKNIEPIDSSIAEASLKTLFENSIRYKVIMSWRPIIPNVNDTDEHLAHAIDISKNAHAVAPTGLFFRNEMATYFEVTNIKKPYNDIARRKILPKIQEDKIISALVSARKLDKEVAPIFRKTSCAVAYSHHLADYNGHYGIRELCDICPQDQKEICSSCWSVPDIDDVMTVTKRVGIFKVPIVTNRSLVFSGVCEQDRYYIQHSLGYQCHDSKSPHHKNLHGRADIGWDIISKEVI